MKRKVLLKRIGAILAVIIGIAACVIVVAFISLHVRTKAILDDCSDMANILGLAVSGQVRRQKIGEQLIASVENWAKGIGISELRVNSGGSRKEAHMFYRKMGFDNEKNQLRFTKQLSV